MQIQRVRAVLVDQAARQQGVEGEVGAVDPPLLLDPDVVELEVRAAQPDLG
jgi:hypothetical protein